MSHTIDSNPCLIVLEQLRDYGNSTTSIILSALVANRAFVKPVTGNDSLRMHQ